MFRLILSVCLIGATLSQETFFKKYGFIKAMTSCFGEEVYYAYQKELANYAKQCHQSPLYLPGMATNNINIPIYTNQQPSYYADVGGQSLYIPVQSYYPNYYGTVQYAAPAAHRNRHTRQVHQQHQVHHQHQDQIYDRDVLQGSFLKVASALSNFTCVLRKANAVDANGNINIDAIVSDYYQTPIDNTLRDDLVQGLNYCKSLVSCLPLSQLRSPLPEDLQRIVMFTKCEKKTRLGACIKHDIRKNLDEFDLSALADLPNTGSRADDIDKLMALIVGVDSVDELELL